MTHSRVGLSLSVVDRVRMVEFDKFIIYRSRGVRIRDGDVRDVLHTTILDLVSRCAGW